MANIPITLIIDELLPRLPVKSLVRFKCVSKEFFVHISDQNFAKLQLKRAYENINQHNINKILIMCADSQFHSLDVETISWDWSALVHLHFNEIALETITVIGSCNGLVALADKGTFKFYIWNPVTREYRRLPDPCNVIPLKHWREICFYGFGYVSSADDYRVVLIYKASDNSFTQVYVFSLRTGCWRRIEDNHKRQNWAHQACHFNGSLYALAFLEKQDNNYAYTLCAFDLESEKFKETSSKPNHISLYLNVAGRLLFNNPTPGGAFGECLCCLWNNGMAHELWVVKKQYELNESRTKKFDISYGVLTPQNFVREWYIIPLCLTKNGGIVVWNGTELRRYHPEENKIEKLVILDGGYHPCPTIVYTESLISPNDF